MPLTAWVVGLHAELLYDARMNQDLFGGSDRLALMQTFVRIVEAGSLSAAADQLGTTQPTVSRRLQALERALGLRLLQRSTHEMTLTADGERCLGHARALLATWAGLEEDMQEAQVAPQGTLRVLVPHAFGQDQLVGPLVALLQRYPGLSVEWLLQDRWPDFASENLDCAVHVGQVSDPGVVARHVAEVPRIVVAAPGVAAQLPASAEVEALRSLPWLALRTYYRDEVVLTGRDGAHCRFAVRPRMSTDSLHALRNAALAGLGAAIMSAWLVRDDLATGRLVQLMPAWQAPSLPVYLVYPQARFYPARLRLFLQAMRAAMPDVAGMLAR